MIITKNDGNFIMQKEVQLILVEDDAIDVMGIQRALKKLKIANPLYIAKDGIEALELLRGQGDPDFDKDVPYLILLDLNMPRMGGLEFLAEVRNDEILKNAVVFVMTTSTDEKDICAAYENHIAGYIVKSKAGQTFIEALDMLDHYWKIIEFPECHN